MEYEERSRLRPQRAEAVSKPAAAKENIETLLKVEPLTVEMGLGLVKFVGGGEESPFLKRIAGIRRQLAGDMGFLLGNSGARGGQCCAQSARVRDSAQRG